MNGLADWFAIFRAGTHTDSQGRTSTFDAGDLDRIVERYAPGEASCVITHDALYSPFGYGQIAEIRREGDVLQARCDAETVEPQFAELVAAGRLANRSVQLVPEESGYRLGHVAFLGAEPPAVSGLAPIEMHAAARTFAAEDAWDRVAEAQTRASLWGAMRRLARRLLPAGEADDLVPEWHENMAREDVGAARADAERENDMSRDAPTTFSAADIEAARRAGADEARAEADRAVRRAAARTELSARIERLVDAGRLTPAQSEGLVELGLALDDGLTLEFTAASGRTTKTSPREHLFTLLEAMPVQVNTAGPIAGADTDPGPGRVAGDADATVIRRAALEYQATEQRAGRAVDIVTAVRHVTARSDT